MLMNAGFMNLGDPYVFLGKRIRPDNRVLSATVQSAIIFVPNQAGWF